MSEKEPYMVNDNGVVEGPSLYDLGNSPFAIANILNSKANVVESLAEELATAKAENEAMRKLLENLIWPNVPSGDDFALLAIMGNPSDAWLQDIRTMADTIRTAQAAARKHLTPTPESGRNETP